MKVIVTRTGKKVLTLKVVDNTLLVTANNRLSVKEIKNIIESKRDWIASKLNKTQTSEASCCETTTEANVGVRESSTDIADMFCGRKIMLCGEIFSVSSVSESKCFLDGSCVYISDKYYGTKSERIKCLKSFIKKISMQNTAEEIARFGSCVSLCPTKIDFKTITNSWMKCGTPTDRVVTLDFRVCQLPEKLQHYIIVHAFSHFTNAGHDDRFWNTVANYLPNYKSCVAELQQYDFLKEI